MGSHSQLMLALATFADARLPSGGLGAAGDPALPPAWRLTPSDVPDLLIRRLEGETIVNAACAVLTGRICGREAAGAGPLRRAARLGAVWEAWVEGTDPGEVRRAEQSGVGYRRIVEQLWGWHDAVHTARQAEWLVTRSRHSRVTSPACLPRPLVLGVAAACVHLGPAETVQLVAHDELDALTRAAERATDAGELERERWLRHCYDAIVAMTWRVAGVQEVDQIPRRGTRRLTRV